MARVLIPFTTGVEEIEFVAVVDILRRAGVDVVTASLNGEMVSGRSQIDIRPDAALTEVANESWDMVVLPGGQPNANLLRESVDVKAVVQRLHKERKSIAAICAAPTALAAYGVIGDKRVTSYPGVKAQIQELAPAADYIDKTVVEDDFLITSRGAGTAVEFALHLIARLCSAEKAEEIRSSIVA